MLRLCPKNLAPRTPATRLDAAAELETMAPCCAHCLNRKAIYCREPIQTVSRRRSVDAVEAGGTGVTIAPVEAFFWRKDATRSCELRDLSVLMRDSQESQVVSRLTGHTPPLTARIAQV